MYFYLYLCNVKLKNYQTMEYEFVRFKNLATDEESHKWWFAAKTARQVMEHAEKFFKPTMQEGYNSAAHDAVEAIFNYV